MDLRHAQFPLRLYAALVIALSDWLVFTVSLVTSAEQFWSINLTFAGLAAFTVWLLEGENGEGASWARALRATSAAVLVAVPFPLLGTVTVASALSWPFAQNALQRRAH
jgi:hypothetical protein